MFFLHTCVKFWNVMIVKKQFLATWTLPTAGNAATDKPACEKSYTGITFRKIIHTLWVLAATLASFRVELSTVINLEADTNACSWSKLKQRIFFSAWSIWRIDMYKLLPCACWYHPNRPSIGSDKTSQSAHKKTHAYIADIWLDHGLHPCFKCMLWKFH